MLNEASIADVFNRLHDRADAHDARVIPGVLAVAGERGASTDHEMADLADSIDLRVGNAFDTLLLPDLCAEYLDYVRGAKESYVSVGLSIDDGLEVSVFLG